MTNPTTPYPCQLLRCLIVEDDKLTRTLMVAFIKGVANCDVAASGTEAVTMFVESLTKGTPYDFILLDVMMPEMDGIEAAKHIRQIEQDSQISVAAGIPIIFISALDSPKEIIRAYCVAQSSAHLVKPVSRAKILHTLRKLEIIPDTFPAD